ncbi:MAG: NUDIX hydrolase [Candidatus Marinimicrobia bacterium]|nr:NUDIX hydrolase [Candidatus Neomarinimicrobiota bacterium]
MSDLIEKRQSSTKIYSGRLLHVFKDDVELPNGHVTTREYIKHPGAAVMIPVLPDGDIMLIKQFRYPIGMTHIELPAGKLDPGESHLETAKRELEEEIGYKSNKLTELTEIHPCTGYSDEKMWIYLAEDLEKTQSNMDHDEFIELFPVSLEKAITMVWSGEISDVKTIIGLLWGNRILSS